MYEKEEKRPVETIPGLRWKVIKENDGGSEFNWYIVRTFVNVTLYPPYYKNKNFKKENKNKTKQKSIVLAKLDIHMQKNEISLLTLSIYKNQHKDD
jgi:hypothetical protein